MEKFTLLNLYHTDKDHFNTIISELFYESLNHFLGYIKSDKICRVTVNYDPNLSSDKGPKVIEKRNPLDNDIDLYEVRFNIGDRWINYFQHEIIPELINRIHVFKPETPESIKNLQYMAIEDTILASFIMEVLLTTSIYDYYLECCGIVLSAERRVEISYKVRDFILGVDNNRKYGPINFITSLLIYITDSIKHKYWFDNYETIKKFMNDKAFIVDGHNYNSVLMKSDELIGTLPCDEFDNNDSEIDESLLTPEFDLSNDFGPVNAYDLNGTFDGDLINMIGMVPGNIESSFDGDVFYSETIEESEDANIDRLKINGMEDYIWDIINSITSGKPSVSDIEYLTNTTCMRINSSTDIPIITEEIKESIKKNLKRRFGIN